ncbi:sensor histidine kinase [Rhodococcoides kyotonense]|uniref:histidine kinase n=1 Tax=Rhodococcoides kyotonense TaxID=398843 RepID=A0A239IVL6_9NOCA|nr:histidine kinase [Rhodococcus kyotonensis]SNS97680.1 Signal transduction histidine kinase [Rhodococcus kyotonensis]
MWTTAAVTLSVFCSLMTLGLASTSDNAPVWNYGFGLLLNLIAGFALIWRHEKPFLVLGLAVAGPLFLETDATAALIALFAVARFATGRVLGVSTALVFAACGVSLTYDAFRRRDYSVLTMGVKVAKDGPIPDWNVPLWIAWLVAAFLVAAVTGLAILRRTQSDLDAAVHTRDRYAKQSDALREEAILVAERTRIARDMHDTLAASLSRISLFAGGLQVNSTEGPEKVANSASLIRQTAHDALDDLKRIIGVLRGTGDYAGGRRSIEGVSDLVHSAREAGTHVTYLLDMSPGELGASTSQVAFRVVQEALTNAQKHAQGAPIHVGLHGNSDVGLRIVVRNHLTGAPAFAYGSGTGLTGLSEQVRQIGGTFDAQVVPGEYLVQAWLPWHT